MNEDQTVAKAIELAAPAMVFGDYYMTPKSFEAIIRMAHAFGAAGALTERVAKLDALQDQPEHGMIVLSL